MSDSKFTPLHFIMKLWNA